MASYPRIDSPCPLRFASQPGAGGFDCSQCQRHVHNLSALSDSARAVFLAGCDESVCVSYTVPRAQVRAGAAWMLAATVMIGSSAALAQGSAAQPAAVPQTLDQALAQMHGNASGAATPDKGQHVESVMLMGGVINPGKAEQVEFGTAAPELPVVVEDEAGDAIGPSATPIGKSDRRP